MSPSVVVAKTFFKAAQELPMADRGRALDFLAKYYEDPSQPGISFERLKHARSSGLWSGRISQELRAIIHKDGDTHTLLYAGRHDDAYRWGEGHDLERHPVTGTLQIITLPEAVHSSNNEERPVTGLFPPGQHSDQYLLSLGVPEPWLATLRRVATDDDLLDVASQLPEEVAERLISLAAGEFVTPPAPIPTTRPIEATAEHGQRFWVIETASELQEVLNKPFAMWLKFLHPSQRRLAEGNFAGPVKVTGSAGTGKTVVAMHRAKHLASHGKRVLLTSYVTTLCENIERHLGLLCTPDERSRIAVTTVHKQARDDVRASRPDVGVADSEYVTQLLRKYGKQAGSDFTPAFIEAEWEQVIDTQGLRTWEEYRGAERRGRGHALSARERRKLWGVYQLVLDKLELDGRVTWAGLCRMARSGLPTAGQSPSYDAVIVDEVQDLRPAEIEYLAALVKDGQLMLVGDAGQRIYPGGFSLRSMGIDVRGRSYQLRVNYRTTEQIRRAADRILGEINDDLDGGTEHRRGVRSVLRGPEPIFRGFGTREEEVAFLIQEIRGLQKQGVAAAEIAIFGRSGALLKVVRDGLHGAKIPYWLLDKSEGPQAPEGVRVGTMHRAKGLEFKVVFAVACADDNVPLKSVRQQAVDDAHLQDILDRERRLLYVSLTRARDETFITWHGKPSRFMSDLVAAEAT